MFCLFVLTKVLFDFLIFAQFLEKVAVICLAKKNAFNQEDIFHNYFYSIYKTDFTVFIILAAILYGSPFEAGLLSSNQPFHPF